ncbi:putative conserved Mce associated membrane protein [Mycobacterium xenopi 4042]|uniref:Putative conserved Mce associated membrane protein n=1 Tax=Mycobacterium xenopi 4042 TaxID=1299334 RepID=X8ALG5_MYCXE|nr:putative conserved Mce associated membrane protein [Mycobacterium xenopi 4042]EUA50463.1 hypothetical protein I552_1399 [Mycobacterium xenopi 3993]
MAADRWALVAGLTAVVVLSALVGWLGFRAYQSHTAEVQRNIYLEVARQGAVNLTTFDYQHVDADVQRILGSATGSFYDNFSHRSRSFVDTVKRSQSKSAGTVTEAGVESQTRDQGQVLVAVTVKTVNSGRAEQEPQALRMRITVHKVGDGARSPTSHSCHDCTALRQGRQPHRRNGTGVGIRAPCRLVSRAGLWSASQPRVAACHRGGSVEVARLL